uniref:Uncharacterized protein n=1 Tax=Parascaris equorum TaxID=6256 RepID=A0A914RNB5_PAREQ
MVRWPVPAKCARRRRRSTNVSSTTVVSSMWR